jgi:hypothetical protein
MAQTTARPYSAVEERIGSIVIRYMSRLNKLLYRLSGGRLLGKWMRGGAIGILGHRGPQVGPDVLVAAGLHAGRESPDRHRIEGRHVEAPALVPQPTREPGL